MKNSSEYPQMGFVGASGSGEADQVPPPTCPPSYDQATGAGYQQIPTHTQVPPGPQPQAAYPNYNTQQPQAAYPNYNTQQPPHNVVIIAQPAVLALGPEPVYITCPSCHIQKLTRIDYTPGTRTHLMAAILCLLGLWCCVCVPYCADSCMNVNHYCGNCNKFLGTYGAV